MSKKKANSEPIGEWIDPSKLKPWAKNPRRNDQAVEQVANSIERFGFGAPIIARKEDSRIIAGHTRWKAARALCLDLVPVRFLNLSDKEAELYAIADNKLNELADWDFDQLGAIVRELSEDDDLNFVDLKTAGFSEEELDKIIEAAEVETFETGDLGGADDAADQTCPKCGHQW